MFINNYNRILLFFLIIFSIHVEVHANADKEKDLLVPAFPKKDISSFSSWLPGQILHSGISFDVNLIEADYSLSKIAYLNDTVKRIDIDTELALISKGKIESCIVRCNESEILANEVKRIILTRKKWKISKRDNEKDSLNKYFTTSIELPGDVVLLDREPVYRAIRYPIHYKKEININRYLNTVANTIYRFHRNNTTEVRADARHSIFGTLELSFVVDKEGTFSNLQYTNNLFPVDFERFVRVHVSSPGGLFYPETKWEPALVDGQPVGIKVKVVIDYNKREYSWNCYLVE